MNKQGKGARERERPSVRLNQGFDRKIAKVDKMSSSLLTCRRGVRRRGDQTNRGREGDAQGK